MNEEDSERGGGGGGGLSKANAVEEGTDIERYYGTGHGTGHGTGQDIARETESSS